jgi:O-antigen/teichoic acid export membrane protein
MITDHESFEIVSKREAGAYILVLSIVSLGAVVGSLGLPKTVVGLVAENMGLGRPERAHRVMRTVLAIGAFAALGISLTYLLVGDLVGGYLFPMFYGDSALLVGVTGLMAGLGCGPTSCSPSRRFGRFCRDCEHPIHASAMEMCLQISA